MVGIYRKIKQVLDIVQQYAPFLDKIAPGVGTLVGSVAQLGDDITEGANNVYEDYNEAKKTGSEYGFLDGVKSFARPASKKSVMNSLSRSYGQLHPRLKLKDET